MCFSLEWFAHFIITCIIIGTAILLLRLLVGFIAPKIGIGGEILAFVTQALTYILWAIVLIALVWFVVGLIGCLLGSGGLHMFRGDDMDLMTAIQSIPGVGPFIPWLTLAITIATALCVVLPAPKTTSGAYYVAYQIINTIAANFGHAKNLSAPESTGIVGGAGAVSAPLIATGAVPLAVATPEQKAVTVPHP